MDLKNKKILILGLGREILGLGREGKSSLRFLEKHYPNNKIAIADKSNAGKSDFPAFNKKYKGFYGSNYLKKSWHKQC